MERTYIVFGASGGIGTEVCRLLRDNGANVVGASRAEERLNHVAQKLGLHPYLLDATDIQQVDNCVQETQQRFGTVHGIVNCVGSLLLKPAHLTTPSEWQSTIASNLTSAFNVVSAGSKAMMGEGGSIVLLSSAAARVGLVNHEAIAAAKAGIIGLTLSAAATYAKRGVRVNCVAPGLIETPLTAKLLANETNLNASRSMHAMGRIGKPRDVAKAIAWLIDADQDWVTGQVIGIDGGLATVRTRN